MKLFSKILFVGAILSAFSSNAQSYLGTASSNYSGAMGIDLQPASFVDGRYKFDMTLIGTNFNFYQNITSFDTKDMPKWWVKSFRPDNSSTGYDNPHNNWMNPDSTFQDRYLDSLDYTHNKPYGIYNNMQLDVLNFMFHINPKVAVGLSFKVRSVTNVDDVDPTLAYLSEKGLDVPSLWSQSFNEDLVHANHMTWAEYGFVYSQVIKDDGEHFMKAGGKAKWISGYAAAYFNSDNFSYNLLNKDSTQSLNGDFSYGHSTGVLDGDEVNGMPKTASKYGWGLDLGFVYEWRPEWKEYKYDMDGETNIWRRDKEKYKLRAGVSILDIGGAKFDKGSLSQDFSVNTNNVFNLRVFDAADGLAGFDSIVDSLIINDPDWNSLEDDGTFFMGTPTALSLQVDYHIWKWFYVNATGMINLQSKKKAHRVRAANQVSITPSFDHAWFGLSVPMSINKYSGFKAGLATRLGPLTIGMTDFKTMFATGKVKGAEFYAGLRIPILYTHPSDIDGDKVSDEKDECLVVPGVWAFRGCPDTDGDGIPDKDDACPNLYGDTIFQGCPDRDHDSIIDPKDDCPDTWGLRKYNGCPDTDNDGIIDSKDACPNDSGSVVYDGCPDTDGDGIFDFLDGCPEVFGPEENNGCPWPDTDGDGILDKDDACPNNPGPIENNGCPYIDTDGDGVLDKDDACPNTPGPVENKGCPVIEEEVQEILNTAFENLEFKSGKDVIKDASHSSLNDLADVLLKKPEWKLQIAGHTDNTGGAQTNLILSKKRAQAVKKFMISKGVEASRLSVLYFGEKDPVADNNTAEGRQKNRRVEMTIIFE